MQRYPMVMRKGEWPDIESVNVFSAEEEEQLKKRGFDTLPRFAPPPPEPKPALTVEERVEALEERITALEARRGGRPKKDAEAVNG